MTRRKLPPPPPVCDRCDGSGWITPEPPGVQYRMCPVCRGAGVLRPRTTEREGEA